ncbi:MAG TPA: hypothetical protein VGK99_24100 [Acidobacteriota bacterium]|jgi:hypothetical protein
MYDLLGILFLVLIASFLLFIPLASGALVVWIWERAKSAIEAQGHVSSRKTLEHYPR